VASSRAFRPRPVGCRWTRWLWTTGRSTPRPQSAASTAPASTRMRPRAGLAPHSAPALRSHATRATRPPCTSTATASTTQRTSSACSSPSHAAAPITCSARASSAGATACPGTGRSRTAARARCSDACSARSRATARPATAPSRHAPWRPPVSATTTTTPRCSRSRCGAPGSMRSRCRSSTGAVSAGARSCATPSIWCAWRPRSGASGARRALRAGPAARAPRRSPPRARTASRRPARTEGTGR